MNRPGARHVGEPVVFGAKPSGKHKARNACMYGAAMVARHMPAFAGVAGEFEAHWAPPATILLSRPGDPDATISYQIPALMLAASPGDSTEPSAAAEYGEMGA